MKELISVVSLLAAAVMISGCESDDNGFDDGDGDAFEVVLAGENEVPVVATAASGEVLTTIEGGLLVVSGEFSDLEAPLMEVSGSPAHVHEGSPDEAGPIVFNLEVNSSDGRSGTIEGTFELTPDERELFERGRLYVNVHTVLNPAGELRGQLTADQPTLGEIDAVFDAELLPENETTEVDSNAVGTATAVVRGRELTLSGQFAGLTTPLMDVGQVGPAHVHEAPPGVDGPVIFPISVADEDDLMGGRLSLTQTLTDEDLAALEAGDHYINVHSEQYPAGEIRGQLIER